MERFKFGSKPEKKKFKFGEKPNPIKERILGIDPKDYQIEKLKQQVSVLQKEDNSEERIVRKVVSRIPKPKDGQKGSDGKSVTLEEVLGVLKVPTVKDIIDELKKTQHLEPKNIKGMPLNMNDLRWHGGGASRLTQLSDVNISGPTDGQALVYDSATQKWVNETVSVSPGGSDTQVQFNDSGSFGGDAGFTYNKTTNIATLGGLVTGDIHTVNANTSTAIVVTAGSAVSGNTAGGQIGITGGDGFGTGDGGSVSLNGGTGGAGVAGDGGAVAINGGQGGVDGAGGRIQLSAGNAGGGNRFGGSMDFNGGVGSGTGDGGHIAFFAGNGGDGVQGVGGYLTFDAGPGGADGDGGDITFNAGGAGGGNRDGGFISITAGAKSGSGSDGSIIFILADGITTVALDGETGDSFISSANDIKIRSSSSGSEPYAILDTSSLASTDKTFTFPNTTGTLGLKNQEITAYGVGTAYSFTNTAAAIDFGTTDPVIVLNVAGTYLITGQVNIAYTGATIATETATIKVRRTNNTAADLSAVVVLDLPASTVLTNTYGIFQIPPFVYTTTATNDSITLFANVSAGLGAGTIDATAVGTSLVAIRLY